MSVVELIAQAEVKIPMFHKSCELSSRVSARLFHLGMVFLAVTTLSSGVNAQPMDSSGHWRVHYEVGGSTSSSATENDAWGPTRPVINRQWENQNGGGSYSEGTAAGVSSSDRPVEQTEAEAVASTAGAITPVFEWIPRTNLQDNPPPSVLQYKEIASASAYTFDSILAAGRFNSFDAEVDCGLDNPQVTSTDWAKNATGQAFVTIANPDRAKILYGETRHLKAVATGKMVPSNRHASEDYCNISYEVTFSQAYGKARFMLYDEDKASGTLRSLYSRYDTPSSPDNSKPTASNRIWVGMEFQVGGNSRLDPEIKNITVRLKEEEDPKLGSEQHAETENHIDINLPLMPGNGEPGVYKWQKRTGSLVGDDGWEDTTESFSTLANNQYVEYRVVWAWDSQKIQNMGVQRLWDHNGEHTASVVSVNGKGRDGDVGQTIEFIPEEGSSQYSYALGKFPERKINVENLLIANVATNNGKQDYFAFDPDALPGSKNANPTIRFTIRDFGGDSKYRWTIKVKDTRTATFVDATVVKGSGYSAGEVVVALNSADILAVDPDDLPAGEEVMGQSTQLMAWGTYSFDIFVKEFKSSEESRSNSDNYIDYQSMRSPYKLQIPPSYQSTDSEGNDSDTESLPGHDVFLESDSENYIKVRATYYLTDSSGKDASNIYIDLLDPKLKLVSSRVDLPVTVSTPHPNVDENEDAYLLYEFEGDDGPEVGEYIGVFAGEDNHKLEYREHSNHRILAVNKRNAILPIEWIPGSEYRESDWVGVWVKPWAIKTGAGGIKTQNVKMNGAYTGNGDQDLPSTITSIQKEMQNGLLMPGTTRAAINGILYTDGGNGYVDNGFVGTGSSNWTGTFNTTATGRYSFGTGKNQKTPSSEECIQVSLGGVNGYAPSSSFRSQNPYGLSNLPPLILNGNRMTSNNAYTGDVPYYRDNTLGFDRSIVGWAQSGNFYMIHSEGKTVAGANYSGWTWQIAGEFMMGLNYDAEVHDPLGPGPSVPFHVKGFSDWMRDNMPNHFLDSRGKQVSAKYRPVIKQAFHLDGATHSSIIYVRAKRKMTSPSLATLLANSEYHTKGFEIGGSHSMVKAYVR